MDEDGRKVSARRLNRLDAHRRTYAAIAEAFIAGALVTRPARWQAQRL